MDALENELVGVFAQVQDALHAHDSVAEFGDEFAKPLTYFNAVEVAWCRDGDGGDVLGVAVLWS